MLTDAASIVLALIAIRLAARPAARGYEYGNDPLNAYPNRRLPAP
jgi:Co/Zn/Cd efflux system component